MAKTVCVLIGPKGSGKTSVDRLAARRFGALPTTEDVVRRVHEISTALLLDFDLTIDNTGLSEGELETRLRGVPGQVENP